MANRKYKTKVKPQFKEPPWPKTTTTPIEPKESQKVDKGLMSRLIHTTLISNVQYHGSRADLRRLKDPDG